MFAFSDVLWETVVKLCDKKCDEEDEKNTSSRLEWYDTKCCEDFIDLLEGHFIRAKNCWEEIF